MKPRHLPDVIEQSIALVPELGPIFADMLEVCRTEGYVAPEMKAAWWHERWLTSTGIIYGAMKALVLVGRVTTPTEEKMKRLWSAQGGS